MGDLRNRHKTGLPIFSFPKITNALWMGFTSAIPHQVDARGFVFPTTQGFSVLHYGQVGFAVVLEKKLLVKLTKSLSLANPKSLDCRVIE